MAVTVEVGQHRRPVQAAEFVQCPSGLSGVGARACHQAPAGCLEHRHRSPSRQPMHRSPPYCRYAPTSQFVVTMRLDKRKSGSWRATGMGSSTALFVGHWAQEGKMPGAFSDLPGKSMQKDGATRRSEEHTSELQSLMRN